MKYVFIIEREGKVRKRVKEIETQLLGIIRVAAEESLYKFWCIVTKYCNIYKYICTATTTPKIKTRKQQQQQQNNEIRNSFRLCFCFLLVTSYTKHR